MPRQLEDLRDGRAWPHKSGTGKPSLTLESLLLLGVGRAKRGHPPGLLYWTGMTHRVGAKGQVVIPKDLRERAGLHPGADVEFELDGQRLSIKAARGRPALGGRFAQSGMAGRLLEDRAREPR